MNDVNSQWIYMAKKNERQWVTRKVLECQKSKVSLEIKRSGETREHQYNNVGTSRNDIEPESYYSFFKYAEIIE